MSDSNRPSLLRLYEMVQLKLHGVGRNVSLLELIEWVDGYQRAFRSEKFPLGKIDITAYQILRAFAETPAKDLAGFMPVVDDGSQKGVSQ